MNFLKQHYEKLLLAVFLLALAGAAAVLPFLITQTKEEVKTTLASPRRTPAPYEPEDLGPLRSNLTQEAAPVDLQLTGEHNLFNPVEWDQRPNGPPYPVTLLDPEKVIKIDAIEPLYTRAEFDSVQGSSPDVKYIFYITLEASENASYRRPRRRALELHRSYDDHPFILREVRGPATNPSELVLTLKDTREEAIVQPGKPYERVDGYKADMRVTEPTEQTLRDKYVGDHFKIDRKDYIIVAIDENSVTVEAKSGKNDSGKRTTIQASDDVLTSAQETRLYDTRP